MRKKVTTILMGAAMMLSIAGCGRNLGELVVTTEEVTTVEASTEATTEKDTESAAETKTEAKTEATEEKTTEEVSTEAVSPEKEQSEHINVSVIYDSINYLDEVDSYLYMKVGYNTLKLDEEDKVKYPELWNYMESYNTSVENDAAQDNDTELDFAKERRTDNPDQYFSPLEKNYMIQLRRADSEVFSFTGVYNGYLGGVHGYQFHGGQNIDVSTGKAIELDDIFTDRRKLSDFVTERYIEDYPKMDYLKEDIPEKIDEYLVKEEYAVPWVIEPDGVTFYFDEYSIGSYADGEQVVKIFFEEAPELFTGKYQNGTGKWGYKFNEYEVVYIDIGADGQRDLISFNSNHDYDYENGVDSITGYTVCVNDGAYSFNSFAIKFEPSIVCCGNGKYYLYVDETYDAGEYHDLLALELTSDKPNFLDITDGNISGSYDGFYINGNNTWDDSQLIDPDEFYIETESNLTSTYPIYRRYRVGEDGLPEPIDDYYRAKSVGYNLTTKVDLEGEVVDENGRSKGQKVSIPEGTVLMVYATDNRTYVDYLNVNMNEYVRLKADGSVSPQTVNGMNIDDVFVETFFD